MASHPHNLTPSHPHMLSSALTPSPPHAPPTRPHTLPHAPTHSHTFAHVRTPSHPLALTSSPLLLAIQYELGPPLASKARRAATAAPVARSPSRNAKGRTVGRDGTPTALAFGSVSTLEPLPQVPLTNAPHRIPLPRSCAHALTNAELHLVYAPSAARHPAPNARRTARRTARHREANFA